MAGVHVIRVGSIPLGLSVLVDERPGSLVVWLLESEWSESLARVVEQLLRVLYAPQSDSVAAEKPGLRAV
ncbi:hypothetical protein [Streptomyces adelaidensis]|uniref:hypothetical protein n=1 Tax=Streptomyces adelaidensis TaxID=2796465 RepID=UPI001906C2DD|nr:hypothetical protein [Streptomyces adelaidensis]